jgi:glycogen(starch) synthase
VFRGDIRREDDGATVLALGSIRPYKGLADAIAAVKLIGGVRLLVAGDARERLDGYRVEGGDAVDWRLGWLTPADLSSVLAAATVAVFPYRPELDQSGALLQALGAGVPAVVYDVGGLGEVVGQYAAGAVVPPGDVNGLAAALRHLLDDPDALAAARAGAERARRELTWDAAANAHLRIYAELA